MKFSTKSRYGLRACLLLAESGGTPISAAALERETAVSGKYLEKIMRMLSARGIVTAVRGQNGGYLLSRPAEKVGVGEIVRALEDDIEIADCAGSGKCRNCAGGLVWSRVYDSINRALDEMTLGSLLQEFSNEQKGGASNAENLSRPCGDNRG